MNRMSLPSRLVVVAAVLFLWTVASSTTYCCHGFLSPSSSSTLQRFAASTRRPSNNGFETSISVQQVPDFSVVDDKEADDDDNDDDNDDDWYSEKEEDDYPKAPYIPPDFSVVDDDDQNADNGGSSFKYTPPPEITIQKAKPTNDDKKIDDDENDNDDDYSEGASFNAQPKPRRIRVKKRDTTTDMAGTSWMEKNRKFTNEAAPFEDEYDNSWDRERRARGGGDDRLKRSIADPKTFRNEFRKTRVFVQNIPEGVSWQDLKDHFRMAGNVVFASISVDVNTGISKGHGIVQFETTDMAQQAIETMGDHPLNGSVLFVREDVQETRGDPNARIRSDAPKGPTPPTKWKCANEDNAVFMSDDDIAAIRNLIKARDDARRRRKYDVSDRIRDELKDSHGVFIDDRLRMWWTSVDGNKVPQSIHDIKGEGRWKLKPWRQIPTTPENDACVNVDLVEGLLKQRDVSRREKDFSTADALLEEARYSPDGDLQLRIHDESRTWRVWTEERPNFNNENNDDSFQERRRMPMPSDPDEARNVAAQECIDITKEYAPEKIDEIKMVLKQFKGREFQVLKRLKQQYL